MIKQIITFLNGNPYETELYDKPKSIIKTLPKWYKDFPKFISYENKKHPTLKSCIPFFDAMTAGYTMTTPCDIKFYFEDNSIKHKVLDDKFEKFIGTRDPIPGFANIEGYHKTHFHWLPHWSLSLPNGYSALYIHPLNRFELPFISTNGIIDNDKMALPGQIPFFLKENFTGVILKNTPIIQIIPFKRENWESVFAISSVEEYNSRMQSGTEKYRNINFGSYKTLDWQQKRYD